MLVYYHAVMRVVLVFVSGLVLGAALLFVGVGLMGGWYTYFILPLSECQRGYGNAVTAEVVPHQPNPCHFRRPRWDFSS